MRFLLTSLTLILSITAASAVPIWTSPALREPIREFPPKAVISGGHVILWNVFAIKSDCTSSGRVTFRMRKEPAHGKLRFIRTRIVAHYPGIPGHHACEGKRVWGQQVLYTARRGFTGRDLVEFEAIFPEGRDALVHIPIFVR